MFSVTQYRNTVSTRNNQYWIVLTPRRCHLIVYPSPYPSHCRLSLTLSLSANLMAYLSYSSLSLLRSSPFSVPLVPLFLSLSLLVPHCPFLSLFVLFCLSLSLLAPLSLLIPCCHPFSLVFLVFPLSTCSCPPLSLSDPPAPPAPSCPIFLSLFLLVTPCPSLSFLVHHCPSLSLLVFSYFPCPSPPPPLSLHLSISLFISLSVSLLIPPFPS